MFSQPSSSGDQFCKLCLSRDTVLEVQQTITFSLEPLLNFHRDIGPHRRRHHLDEVNKCSLGIKIWTSGIALHDKGVYRPDQRYHIQQTFEEGWD